MKPIWSSVRYSFVLLVGLVIAAKLMWLMRSQRSNMEVRSGIRILVTAQDGGDVFPPVIDNLSPNPISVGVRRLGDQEGGIDAIYIGGTGPAIFECAGIGPGSFVITVKWGFHSEPLVSRTLQIDQRHACVVTVPRVVLCELHLPSKAVDGGDIDRFTRFPSVILKPKHDAGVISGEGNPSDHVALASLRLGEEYSAVLVSTEPAVDGTVEFVWTENIRLDELPNSSMPFAVIQVNVLSSSSHRIDLTADPFGKTRVSKQKQ